MVVRHGATFPDQADTDPSNFDNIAAQRNLNDKGKALAKAFGDAMRQAGVPVGKVYTSKFNRAYETAVIAGFKDIERQPAYGNIPQAHWNCAEAVHRHHSHHAPAEHYRCAWQGLVRCQGRRSLNLSLGRWRLQARGPRADGRMAAYRSNEISSPWVGRVLGPLSAQLRGKARKRIIAKTGG
jgi:hypothetical protein